jgi:hypothetical protein
MLLLALMEFPPLLVSATTVVEVPAVTVLPPVLRTTPPLAVVTPLPEKTVKVVFPRTLASEGLPLAALQLLETVLPLTVLVPLIVVIPAKMTRPNQAAPRVALYLNRILILRKL